MAQYDFPPDIDTAVTDGIELSNMLENFRTAQNTNHSGVARPSYAVQGMLWYNSATGIVNLFNGTADVPFGDTAIARSVGKLTPHENLAAKWGSNSTVIVTADGLLLFNTAGKSKRFTGVNHVIDITTVGANGRDSAVAEAASTWYAIHEIGKEDGSKAGLFSTSFTNPTLPTGYTYSGLIGAVRNDSGSNFLQFVQANTAVACGTPAATFRTAEITVNANYQNFDLSALIPPNAAEVTVNIEIRATAGTNSVVGKIAPDATGATASFGERLVQMTVASPGTSIPAGPMALAVPQSVKGQVAGTNGAMSLLVAGYRF